MNASKALFTHDSQRLPLVCVQSASPFDYFSGTGRTRELANHDLANGQMCGKYDSVVKPFTQ